MKNSNRHTHLGLITLIILISGIFQACETEIPDVDAEPPKFEFRITGDGFAQTFDQDTDFDSFQLNLREDALYEITFTGSDSGGVKQIQWQYATDYVEFESSIPSPWTTSSAGLSSYITWNGDASNPLTGMILATSIRPVGENISHEFTFSVSDFGGSSSMENTVFGSLNIYSGNHATEIIRF